MLAAFGWSAVALFFGDAGEPGMTMGLDATSSGSATDDLYLEVSSAVTVFMLAGRYFEAKAKRRAGSALRALLELGAKDVAVLRDGHEVRAADRAARRRVTASSCGPARRSRPTAWWSRAARRSTPRW